MTANEISEILNKRKININSKFARIENEGFQFDEYDALYRQTLPIVDSYVWYGVNFGFSKIEPKLKELIGDLVKMSQEKSIKNLNKLKAKLNADITDLGELIKKEEKEKMNERTGLGLVAEAKKWVKNSIEGVMAYQSINETINYHDDRDVVLQQSVGLLQQIDGVLDSVYDDSSAEAVETCDYVAGNIRKWRNDISNGVYNTASLEYLNNALKACLDWRMLAGGKILKKLPENSAKNVTYRSDDLSAFAKYALNKGQIEMIKQMVERKRAVLNSSNNQDAELAKEQQELSVLESEVKSLEDQFNSKLSSLKEELSQQINQAVVEYQNGEISERQAYDIAQPLQTRLTNLESNNFSDEYELDSLSDDISDKNDDIAEKRKTINSLRSETRISKDEKRSTEEVLRRLERLYRRLHKHVGMPVILNWLCENIDQAALARIANGTQNAADLEKLLSINKRINTTNASARNISESIIAHLNDEEKQYEEETQANRPKPKVEKKATVSENDVHNFMNSLLNKNLQGEVKKPNTNTNKNGLNSDDN
jgi:hypothetical protein